MKLKYLGKGKCESKEAQELIVDALSKGGLAVHKRNNDFMFTVFAKEKEEEW